MSAIAVFNFLQEHTAEIIDRTDERLRERWGSDRKPGRAFRPLLARLFDGYVDVLISGHGEVLERIALPLVRLLPLHGLAYSDALAVPLTMGLVARRLFMDDHARRRDAAGGDPPSLEEYHDDIDRIEEAAHVAAANVLDVLQRHVHETVTTHNTYLERVRVTGGVSIEPLRLGHRLD